MQSKHRGAMLVLSFLAITLSSVAGPAAAVGPITEAIELFPVEPGANSQRGFAVALDGDRLAVGAPLDDAAGETNAGAVYVFRWEGTSWAQEAKLFADPPEKKARFGSAVALHDGVLAVGALGVGAVYLFDDGAGDVWTQRQRVAPMGEGGVGVFGRAVALDKTGDRLAVGAVGPHGRGPGAVFLYSVLETEPWISAPLRIAPGQPQPRERFGQAVALAGDLLVVGAPGHSPTAEVDYAGASYAFRWRGESWAELPKLVARDAAAGDQLGAAVATDGTTVALGAPTADRPRTNSGAVYVARCDGRGCDVPERLANPDVGREDHLGFSVAMDGDLLAAGELGHPRLRKPTLRETGGVTIYRRVGSSWEVEDAPAPNNVEPGDLAGFAVAADGERAVATGVLGDQGSVAAGAVWSFVSDSVEPGEEWREEGEAVARDPLWRPDDPAAGAVAPSGPSDDPPSFSVFGSSVAATEDYVAVGSRRASASEDSPAGEMYVYRRAGNGFRQEVRLTSPAGKDARDGFGAAVALDGTLLLVAAPDAVVHPGPQKRRSFVHLFSRVDGRWKLRVRFFLEEPKAGDVYGAAVDLEGRTVVIGLTATTGLGAVFVHEPEGKGWAATVLQAPDGEAGDEFGAALSLDHGLLAIGAPGVSSAELPLAGPQGGIYLARRQESTWSGVERLSGHPGCASPDPRLGAAVSLSEDTLAVVIPNACAGAGSVVIYEPSGSSWTPMHDLDLEDVSELGASVAIGGGRLVAGVQGVGSAVLFRRNDLMWEFVTRVDAVTPTESDRFGSAVALAGSFYVVAGPDPARGDRVPVPLLPAQTELEP